MLEKSFRLSILSPDRIAQSLQLLVYAPLSILSTQCIYVFRIVIQ